MGQAEPIFRIRGHVHKNAALRIGGLFLPLLDRLALPRALRLVSALGHLFHLGYLLPGNPGPRILADLRRQNPGLAPPRRLWREFSFNLSHALACAYLAYQGQGQRVVDETLFAPGTRERLEAARDRWGGGVLAMPHCLTTYAGVSLAGGVSPSRMAWKASKRPLQRVVEEKLIEAMRTPIVIMHGRTHFAFIRECLRWLRKGEFLAVAADRFTSPGKGARVVVFGQEMWLHKWYAEVAVAAGKPVLPSRVTIERGRRVLAVEDPIPPGDPDEMARAWVAAFERDILRHPQDWNFLLDRKWCAMIRAGTRRIRGVGTRGGRPGA